MTNGEKIKATFPHYDIEIDEHKGYVRVFYEDFYTTYPLRWWDAEYKELIDYKARFERRSKIAEIEILISQLKADRDRLLEVLSKIRAEIETKYGQCSICEFDLINGEYTDIGDIADILQIIDKYKVKSEVEDGNDD